MKARVCVVADRGATRVDYELKCTESWFGSLPMGLFNKEAGQESSHGVNLEKIGVKIKVLPDPNSTSQIRLLRPKGLYS